MFSYTKIIKDSYRITMQNKILWLFGLLVVGGFNLNFFYFQNIELPSQSGMLEIAKYFQHHPGILALVSFLVLVVSLVSLVLTNWGRIILTLLTSKILETGRIDLQDQLKKSTKSLFTVIRISLLTTFLMICVAGSLLLAPVLLAANSPYQVLLAALGSAIFLPLAFTISCLNIFTTYFAVLWGLNLKKALDVGTDFVISHWSKILGLAVVLIIIYTLISVFGVAVFFLLKLLKSYFEELGIWRNSAIMVLCRLLLWSFWWLLIAGLNVFFNTALLMLFLELVKPVKKDEVAAKEMATSPALP
jgi:hypothetical protein